MGMKNTENKMKESLILSESQYKQFLKIREAEYNKALAALEMFGGNITPIKSISFRIECEQT